MGSRPKKLTFLADMSAKGGGATPLSAKKFNFFFKGRKNALNSYKGKKSNICMYEKKKNTVLLIICPLRPQGGEG